MGMVEKNNIEYAIELLHQSENLDHIGASMELGKIYEEGIGVRINLLESFIHYHKAAQKRDPYALFKVADLIEKGVNEEQDEQVKAKQIIGFYKTAIGEGSTKAKVRLAEIIENGEYGYRVDKAKALEYYESVINEEDKAMNRIGMELYDRGDYQKAFDLFTQAAEKDNPKAINNLGTCYELGKGTKRDILKAMDLYEDASSKGNAQAMSNLGFFYITNKAKITGNEEYYYEAAHCFRFAIAEDEQLKDAHYYLGCLNMDGCGVDKNLTLAFKCFKKAVECGHDIACQKIGDLCYSGFDGNRPNKTKAFEWYCKGAEKENSQCINNIGLMYETGFDQIRANPQEAIKCYERAAKLRNLDAIYNIGIAYLHGVYVEPDNLKAIDCLKNAANLGHLSSQTYLVNLGIVKDKNEFILSYEQDPYGSEDDDEGDESEDEKEEFSNKNENIKSPNAGKIEIYEEVNKYSPLQNQINKNKAQSINSSINTDQKSNSKINKNQIQEESDVKGTLKSENQEDNSNKNQRSR